MKKGFITFFLLQISLFVFAQNSFTTELDFEVNASFKPHSISKAKLSEAQTLGDLNKFYRPSWIREFISVEVTTIYKGKKRKISSKNDRLTPEQIDFMNTADDGTNINVNVQYIPENTLKNNETREIDFSFYVTPTVEAEYTGGFQQMKQYLKKNAINKITTSDFFKSEYNLAAIKFTINEEGEVTNPHVVESSKDEKVDELLLETIAKMPCWKPAQYANGTKVKQDCVLTVGNHKSCVINLLDISRD